MRRRSVIFALDSGQLVLSEGPDGADGLPGTRQAAGHPEEELVRADMTLDWMPGVVPRCVPMETKNNQHGERATTVVVGIERVETRGKWRTVEVLASPVT